MDPLCLLSSKFLLSDTIWDPLPRAWDVLPTMVWVLPHQLAMKTVSAIDVHTDQPERENYSTEDLFSGDSRLWEFDKLNSK